MWFRKERERERERVEEKNENRTKVDTHRYVGFKFVALAIVALLQGQNAFIHAEIIVLPIHHVHSRFGAIIEDVEGNEP